ncbi:zinc metalloproteinase-disintegrin-like ohanin [Hydractinia symbiolongicarpus]|uniref:zinc metalloproteinase-disintegrin-like ohanin n=1 Tax=Hydractinia symbiolongicarpus TaxID=13093 RepID=UPI00254D1862|nr:zinc metalloproteinase-disintegrin-like ohanin [Hydractinia symbiolongicarpus]
MKMLLVYFLCCLAIKKTLALPAHLNHVKKYEVVKPFELKRECKGKDCDLKREYIIPTKAERYHVSVEQQSFLHNDFKVSTQSKNGELTITRKNDVKQCHYRGTLKNGKGKIILTTCKGLRGVLIDEKNNTYVIEPMGTGDRHIIYQHKTSSENQTKHSNDAHQHAPVNDIIVDSNSDWNYAEVAIVGDYSFSQLHSNVDEAISFVMSIVNYMNYVYECVQIKIILTNLELWTHFDAFHVDKSTLISNIEQYNNDELMISRGWKHDNLQFLTGHDLGGLGGLGGIGTICRGASSNAYAKATNPNPHLVAANVAHEFGHSLGLGHDHAGCHCPTDSQCVMGPYAAETFVNALTDCSQNEIIKRKNDDSYKCFKDVPQYTYSKSRCGNYVVEEEEECDCGPEELCTSKCCDPATCKLLSTAQCDQGTCCDQTNCQYKPADTICRASGGECDFEDRCTGTDAFCPEDVYLADYTSCNSKQGYCVDGRCSKTLSGQCKLMWGTNAFQAVEECFVHNTHGGTYANCGKNADNTYIPCKMQDIYCGKVLCSGGGLPNSPLIGGGYGSSIWTVSYGSSQYTCKSPVGMSAEPDPSYAQDGTKCGVDSACHHGKCVLASNATQSACRGLCQEGKCTNTGACFCNPGFGGSTCSILDITNAHGKVYYPACYKKCATGKCDTLSGKCTCPPGRACPDCATVSARIHTETACSLTPQCKGSGVDCGDIFSGAYTTYQCVHAHSLTENNFVLLQSFRDNVDWSNMDVFVKRITCQCARLARDGGYASFGIRYWAECWASKATAANTGTTESMECQNTSFQPCTEADQTCVGMDYSMFLYDLKQ